MREELHKHVWGFLNDNPERIKEDWQWDHFRYTDPISYQNRCFACGEAYSRAILKGINPDQWTKICKLCPIDWEITSTCIDEESYYKMWLDAEFDEKQRLAEKILKLDWIDNISKMAILHNIHVNCPYCNYSSLKEVSHMLVTDSWIIIQCPSCRDRYAVHKGV